jgi:hypothetical protein
VHVDLICRKTCLQRRVEFPARNHVASDLFVGDDFIDRLAGKGLRGIQDQSVPAVFVFDRFAVDGAHIAYVLFVEYIDGRGESGDKFYGIASADFQMPFVIHFQGRTCVHVLTTSPHFFFTVLLYQKCARIANILSENSV